MKKNRKKIIVTILVLIGLWAIWYFLIRDGANTRMYHGGGQIGRGGFGTFSIGSLGYPYQYNSQIEVLYDKNGNAINPQPNQKVSCNTDCLVAYSPGSKFYGYYYCNKNCSGGSF